MTPGPTLDDVRMGARLLRRLPGFLRDPVTPAEARASLQHRLAHREAAFLALARQAIYGGADSPYLALLRHAGCDDRDLERLVRREGIEGALAVLLRTGVYLTVEELKGRRPVRRGSLVLHFDPRTLWTPGSVAHLRLRTSGSRGTAATVPLDLAVVRDLAVNLRLGLDARGADRWVHAEWGVPGTAAVENMLLLSVAGSPPRAWFSQVGREADLHARYRWSGSLLRGAGLLAGRRVPPLVHVPLDEADTIATWMAGVLRRGGVPHLVTFASSAVRVCQAATARSLDLHGASFTVGGEPVTAARLAEIRRTGATAAPWYGSTEAGTVGLWCLAPDAPDEVHVLHDRLALIQAGPAPDAAGPAEGELFVTSLRPTSAPLVLLNVSMGDRGAISPRPCACPLADLGWAAHLHSVRSFEKLTAGGMTFLDADLVRVLDEVLPARFGGGPTDYQLVEEESDTGRPVVRLLVHARVGTPSAPAVADAFLEAIAGTDAARVMARAWRQAGLLRVEHRPPLATSSGKILHLHVEPRPAS